MWSMWYPLREIACCVSAQVVKNSHAISGLVKSVPNASLIQLSSIAWTSLILLILYRGLCVDATTIYSGFWIIVSHFDVWYDCVSLAVWYSFVLIWLRFTNCVSNCDALFVPWNTFYLFDVYLLSCVIWCSYGVITLFILQWHSNCFRYGQD